MNQLSVRQLSAGETLVHGLLHLKLHFLAYRRSLLHSRILLSAHHLDVSRVAEIGCILSPPKLLLTAHASVSAVGATTHHGSLVHLHMADTQVLHVQTLRLSVGLQVVQKDQEELAGSLGPSALVSRSLNGVRLGVTADTTVEAGERHGLLVGNHVVKVLLGLEQRHVLDSSAHLVSVLEVHSQVRATGLAAYT